MKFNFWQWLAVVLLIVGCVWWVYDIRHPKNKPSPAPTNPPATQNIRAQ